MPKKYTGAAALAPKKITRTTRLNLKKIQEDLATDYIGLKILLVNSCTSTMDVAAACPKDMKDGGLIIAREQTAARGRRKDSVWYSPKDKGIYVTFAFRSKTKLTVSKVATYVACFLDSYSEGRTFIYECGNDIIAKWRKLGGVIIQVLPGKLYYISIGINVFKSPKQKELPLMTTFEEETELKRIDINNMLARLLNYLEFCLI